MPVQNFFGSAHPKKNFGGEKTCKIWANFKEFRSSAANISETDKNFQNRIFIPFTAISQSGEVSSSDLGDLDVESSSSSSTTVGSKPVGV